MKTAFESLLSLVGGFGHWQRGILFATCFSGYFLNFCHIGYVYHSAEPDHWCNVKELQLVNWTEDEIKKLSIPRENMDGKSRFSRCSLFQRNYSELSHLTYEEASKLIKDDRNVSEAKCQSWNYDKSYFTRTTVSEWNLVCDRMAFRPTIQSVYNLGVFLSAVFFGPIMDRFGRKKAVMIGVLLFIPCPFASAMVPNYFLFLVVQFITGFAVTGIYSSCFILMLEVMSIRKRIISTFVFELGPPAGTICFAGISYLLPDWRNLYFAAAGSSCILIFYFWILPESPRWLMLKGRFSKAEIILRHAAKMNRKEMPSSEELKTLMITFWESEVGSKPESPVSKKFWERAKKVLVLWITPEMRSRSFKMFWTWFVISLVAYGITFLTVKLPLSTHLLMVVLGLQSILVRLLAIWQLSRFGRRTVYSINFFSMAIFLVVFLFIPVDFPYVSWTVLLFAFVGVIINFTLVYLYTAEIFPTEVRGIAVSMGSLHARIAAISAPFMVDLLGSINRLIPAGILAAVLVAAGIVSLLLPETKDKKLPDTVNEVEEKSSQINHNVV